MQTDTVIFDMDGLLIDSEPYWQEAGIETLDQFGVKLTWEQYQISTGLRTKEWIEYWFNYFDIDRSVAQATGETIVAKAIEKIKEKGIAMPGIYETLAFFKDRKFRIGLATSSPQSLIDVVVDKLKIRQYFEAYSSAENLDYSKPHPQVFMNCAQLLHASPLGCICFEDSFNGMISAKAARMKCVIVPSKDQYLLTKWNAADLKLSSLEDWNAACLDKLG